MAAVIRPATSIATCDASVRQPVLRSRIIKLHVTRLPCIAKNEARHKCLNLTHLNEYMQLKVNIFLGWWVSRRVGWFVRACRR